MQQLKVVEPLHLLETVGLMKKDGYRLVQVLCTRVEEGFEITYSFDKDYVMENVRCIVPEGGSVMSITSQFWSAFVWENEIHDLFGVNIEFIAPEVDFGGHFFHLAKENPWAEYKAVVKPVIPNKVTLRPGLGVDATVKPAAPQAPAAKAAVAAEAEVKPAGGEQRG